MASRLKEDEKNERIIRGLLKLPENRRCINCNSLGPQYVCTNFWTFVCTNCSGIHREFTHRVKSISMAKFTSQEVGALQEGGNQHAKEIYFKEWDPQRQSFPDSNNVDRLRDFIKHVYVDRKFTGERTYDKPPRGKGERDDFYENRRFDTYQGGSKSPPYEDTYERRYSDRSSSGGRSYDERRSPGYDQESRQYGDNKRSPGRPPVINDWRREDRFGDRRMSDGDYKLAGQSPERTKDLGSSSPPVVRPVREILGENVVPLRISEPPRANSGRASDGATLTQRTASSSSLASSNGNPAEVKLETTKSLIDFDTEPEPPSAPAISQAAQTAVVQSVVQPANSSDDNNWASFDIAPATQAVQAAQGPSNVNPLESVLSQLSVPTSVPAPASGAQGGPDVATAFFGGSISTLPKTGDSSVLPAGHMAASTLAAKPAGDATIGSFSAFPNTSMSVASPALTTVSPLNDAGQWPNLQHQQPLFPAAVSQSTTQQTTTPAGGALNSQPWNIPPAPTIQGHPSTSMLHAPHLVAKPAIDANPGISTQPSSAEVKPTGRRELPEDLFTLKYPSFPAPIPAWQMGPQHGMVYPVQYNTMVPMPSFPQSSKSINPFDVGNERPPVQAPTFPSMSSLQGALPSVSPPGVMLPSSLGNPSLSWMPPQSSSYGTVLPQQTQTLPSAMAPRSFMGQRMPTSMPMQRPQETGSLSAEGAALGFSSSVSPNPYSVGGNPFG